MAKIIEYRNIPLDDLVIGKGQVRTQNLGKGIDELAESIKKQGLLQPIVVCEAESPGKWEILTGQRRFLAHKQLNMETIAAAVLDGRVDTQEAKVISITENLMRQKLSDKELIDGIVPLYNHYGTAVAVAEATGLPYHQVLKYVKYPRLLQELKTMVDNGEVNINVAIKAQDAASAGNLEKPDPEIAVKLAQEMARMSGNQQKKVIEERKKDPSKPVDDVIEKAKSPADTTQITISLTQTIDSAITKYAKENDQSKNDAAVDLIEEALKGLDFLKE